MPVERLPDQQSFWGDFLLLVSKTLRDQLDRIATFEFFPTRHVQTEFIGRKYIVHYVEQPDELLYWARPLTNIAARVKGEPNDVCSVCDYFIGPRQLTRLLVNVDELPQSGIFSVKQNRVPQIFVTEEAKDRLLSCGVAAKFSSAGQLE